MSVYPKWICLAGVLIFGTLGLLGLNLPVDAPDNDLFQYVDASIALSPKQKAFVDDLRAERSAGEVQLVKIRFHHFGRERILCNVGRQKNAYEATDVRREGESLTWSGKIPRTEFDARFYVKKGMVGGSFVTASGQVYNIRPLGDGLHAIIRRLPPKVPDHPK